MAIHLAFFFLFFALHSFVQSVGSAPLSPVDLRVEYLPSPALGIDVPKPRFSWVLRHTDRGQSQMAYQILISQLPTVPSGDVWDSGKVASSFNSQIPIGVTLQSDHSYFWKVRWWDINGNPSDYSNIAQFDTGLNMTEWKGHWIGGVQEYDNLFRKSFTITSSFHRARIFICGLGYYELYINGAKVGDHRLDPGWTDYNVRSLYVEYDVGKYLVQGSNAIGVILGAGWYGQGLNGPRSLMFQLSLDGQVVVVSDTTWKNDKGPITYDSIYNGETYDARLEQPGWSEPKFDDHLWSNAVSIKGPGGILSSQLFPPIRVHNTVLPKAITSPSSGVYIFDFEQNFSGWVVLNVNGPLGTTITLRHAEILNRDGTIYVDNLRTAKATDTYILKGDSNGEVYEPRFTYHGFRFVEITGFPGTPTLSTLVGVHAYSSVQNTGAFEANPKLISQIQHNIWWGQTSNLMSVPTDCDQRDERRGWMADGLLSSAEAFQNFFMPSFYSNWVQLMKDDEVNGGIADTVPYMDNFGGRPGDPSWTAAYPGIVYELWKRFNDIRIITQHMDGLTSLMNFLISKASQEGLKNFMVSYGDWVPPPPQPPVSGHLASSFYFLLSLQQVAELADVIGRQDISAQYLEQYQNFSQQFNQQFYNSQTHLYDNGVQTGLLMPLYLRLVPLEDIANLTNNLLNDIVTSHDTHLTTGILGTKYLPIVLSEMGRTDLALELALTFTYPSWGYMIYQVQETPATTLWELWDSPSEGPGMNSRNHIMFGSIGDWFYTHLAGIKQRKGSVGFNHISISPPPADVLIRSELTSVNATTYVPTGRVSVAWQRSGGIICGSSPENSDVTISCGGKGGGVIKSIDFASFGTPQGTCGAYSLGTCNAQSTLKLVENWCLGKSSCTIPSNTTVYGDPCFDTTKKLLVQASCSNPLNLYSLYAQIPVNSDALIHVSKLDLTNVVVTESGQVVWKNNQFYPTQGIIAAIDLNGEIIFSVGSGEYQFEVTGSKGIVFCGIASETEVIPFQCPDSQTFSVVEFASFGTPTGGCPAPRYGNCHAGSSKYEVERLCLHKNSCVIVVQDLLFGDPCYDTAKSLLIYATCS